MLIGAFTGAVGAYFSGNPWVGVLLGLLSGTLLGLLLSLLTITYKAHQFVTGIGLNIFATGLTAVLTVAFWGTQGYSPRVEGIPTLHLAFLDHIPFIGPILSRQPYLVWLTFFLAVVSWVFFFRTKKGLRIRALGENPEAASAIGLPVNRLCYISVIISSMLASGEGLPLSNHGANLFNGHQRRTVLLGLAACIFGNWNPWRPGCRLLFGLGEAVQIRSWGNDSPVYRHAA